MEQLKVESPKKGLTTSIIASILTTMGIIFLSLWGVMVNEHFKLQASAENFEGLGSIGIIIVGIIFAILSLACVIISIVLSIITIIRSSKQFRLVGIILCVINFLVIVLNGVLFIVLKQG